ncbi:hypothetical protein [Rothia terrae]|uniref:Uncharacterized protein n=1 Tax=Rothia terrae TaxID=396015 RepID=A0A7S7B077_9MICC|nr:hypothetical protein [Rothia terrae]QOW64646.1 hypothetical protein IDM49_11285 [Rothia terrae]
MLTRRATLTAAPLAALEASASLQQGLLTHHTVNQNVSSTLKEGANTTTNTFAGMTQKQLIAQQSSKEGTFVCTHGLNDRYGNPMVEKSTSLLIKRNIYYCV